jgi:hypothetical protein
MSFVYGTALVVAAILLLGVAKYAVTHFEESSRIRNFAVTETLALLVTCMVAFGIAFLGAGIASNDNGIGIAELAVSLGVIAAALLAVMRFSRARDRRARTPVTEAKPGVRATT